jgi:CheY-like chemotaxis protein
MDATLVESSAAAADRLAEATASARPYALMLLDARLRDGDAPELVAKTRERSGPRIILLLAHDRPGDLDSSRGVRADAHLLKPVVEGDLAESIAAVLGGRRGGWGANLMPEGGHAASRRSAFAPSLRVLVAEDNEFNAQLMQALLARRGHDVHVARTGREALRLVDAGGYDLVLLDIHMPEFDGFEVIRAIRERERATGGHLPVIAVTARSRREDRERCIAAGMDHYLAKPIGASDLWAAINRVTGA